MNRERIAALMWHTQVVDAGSPKSVAARRTPEAFTDSGSIVRNPWLKQADAIMAALPDMIAPLVWDGFDALFASSGPYVIQKPRVGAVWGLWFGMDEIDIDADKVALAGRANAHHRAAIMAAFKEPTK